MQRARALQQLGATLRAQAEASAQTHSGGARRWRSTSREGTGAAPPAAPPAAPAAGAAPEAAAAADAEAKARALAEARLKMDTMGLFPWERYAFGDRTEGLKWWQKAYWLGFA